MATACRAGTRAPRPGLFGAVRSLRHRGHNVYCACCGGEFDSFIPHRAVRPGRCPAAARSQRHRLLVGFRSDRTDLLSAQLSVLHIAPEYSQRRLRRLENLTYRSADLDSPLAMDKVDLLSMPYADDSFDVVICNHVLEHVDDDRLALEEIRRVFELRAARFSCRRSMISFETVEDAAVTSPGAPSRVRPE